MRRIIATLSTALLPLLAVAQNLTLTFADTPLTEALRRIDQSQSDKRICFFCDELERFRVTKEIKEKSAVEAVRSLCAKLPVSVEAKGDDIFVKAKRERTIALAQFVRNSFTRYGIAGTLITVMDEAGSLIDTLRTQPGAGGKEAQVWTLSVPRRPAKFKIRAEHPDYETGEMEVEMKNPARLNSYNLPDMLLKIREGKTVDLNELVVSATRVQLCYKGDTIVVDARAFKISEGSMLDALVKSVPGCELRDNGDIYMNGKKVDYLMLNGKEFFKGNNRLMLDNLPYYTVDKLQFYNKRSERSELLGKEVERPDFVMDVRLKQEYSIGYLGNAEAAAGTHGRHMGRAFGLRFTDNSRLTLFGNANNVNESRQPGSNGDWGAAASPIGDTRLYNVGGELLVDDKFGRYKEVAGASASWSESENETRTASASFLPSGTVYGRARQKSVADNFGIKASNSLTLKEIGLKWEARFDIAKSDADEWQRTGQFAQSPAGYGSTTALLDSLFAATTGSQILQILVNRTDESAALYNRRWNAQHELSLHRELPWGDDIVLSAVGRWSDAKERRRDHYLLAFRPSGGSQHDEAQERDTRARDRSHNYRVGVSYSFHFLNHWHLTLSDHFSHRQNDAESNLYRLDWDENFAADAILPSQLDYARLQDSGNSWSSLNTVRANELSASIHSHKNDPERGRYTSFTATLPAHYTWAIEDYTRGERSSVVSDHRWLLGPSVNLEHNTRRWRDTYIFNYLMEMRSPDLTQRVAFTDTSNPLRILVGNPHLRPSHIHTLDFTFHTRFGQHSQNLSLQSQAAILCDLVAQSIAYNPLTGAYTFCPVNVGGNRRWLSSLAYRRNLNEERSLSLDAKTSFNYFRNVDVKADALNRTVHCQTGESAKLEYQREKMRIALTGSIAWNHVALPEAENICSIDFDYGLSASLYLAWQLSLATDAKMYSRRGYTDRALNSDNLLWNAQLSRPFVRGRLLVSLKGFDLLHQISQTRATINAQGRTERWQLSLPNYLMLSAQWKFSKSPKGK